MTEDIKYELTEDKRVRITFTSESADLKKLDNETVIGDYKNLSICYIESKDACIDDLQEKYDKYSMDLASIDQQLDAIEINDTLAEELVKITEVAGEVFKAVSEVKDYSNEKFVAENPKKYGKLLRDTRILKENVIGEIKNIDVVTGLHKKKTELLAQQKLYNKEVTKIGEQLEEVKTL